MDFSGADTAVWNALRRKKKREKEEYNSNLNGGMIYINMNININIAVENKKSIRSTPFSYK